MIDDPERLVRSAEFYNRPPEVPRELMWSRISARRAVRSSPPQRWLTAPAPWIGMAATLVLGIGLGRVSVYSDEHDRPARSAAVAPALDPARASRKTTESSGGPVAPSTPALATAARAARTVDDEPPAARRARAIVPVDPAPAPETDQRFVLATNDYMRGAETLLSHLGADDRAKSVPAEFAAQARDLLLTTRLLLDSPVGEDPEMASLLADLELVLSQASLLHAGNSTDLALVIQAIGRHELLKRVRSAAPDPAFAVDL